MGFNDITERKAAEDTLRRFFDAGRWPCCCSAYATAASPASTAAPPSCSAVSAAEAQHALDDYLAMTRRKSS